MDDISLGLYPGLRLCPLDLTTNHGLLRCPSLYCGASLDSFSQAVATSAVSTGPHDQPWTAPVSVSLLWSFSGQFFTSCCHLGCVHWTSRPTMDCSGVRLFTVELLWTVFHKLLPPRLCPLDLTTNHGLLRCPSLYCGASLDSFHKLLPPRLCPLDLTTNHGLLRCPSLYCGASLDSFSQAVATSAVSTGPHDQPWTAPVSVSLLWSFSGQFFTSCCHLGCVHWTSRPTMDCSGVRLFTVELLWTVFHKLLPPRLCPLDLTTNHGLLRCPSLYCGASLDSFSQAVATSAVSTGPHDQPWTAPVSVSLLWSFSGQFFTSCCHLGCVHWTSRPTMDCSGVRLFTVELLWTVFHKLLPPRLCPLDLTTNHGLLRCPSLYCGASLDSFSQAVATSAVSTGPHDQPWTAPVSVSLLWSFSGQFFTSCCHLGCVHWTSRPTMDCSGVRLFTVELLWTVFHKLLPPRLCPLDLTTNHGLLRCPSLYCGASLDSFSQAVATSAVSTGPHDQPWTAPVSVSLLWSFSGQFFTSCCHLGCVHWTSRPTMDCSGVRLFTVELLWTVFHKLLPPRLCPLDLTTNHGLLRCPSLYCGASLDSFSQAVATSAVSTGPHDQPWTAPVSVSLLWSFSGQFFTSCCHLGCVHWTSRPTMDCSGVRLFTVELLWTVFHKLLPPRLCPLDLTTNHGLLRCPSLYCGASLDSFHKLLPPRLCPLDLTTNHGLLRCPSLYCGASLDSFSQAVATSAVSTGPHDQPWTAPVSVSLLWSFSGQFFTSCCHLGCVHWTSRPTMDCSGVRLFTVELLWTVFHKLLPPRLCPLDLTTNHGLLRCPSLYCGASLDSFSQAVATSAVSTGPHDQPWTAPVSVSLLWSFSGQFFTSCCHLGCVHWTSRPTMDCSGVRLFTVELLWTVFHKLLPPRLCPLDLTTNHGLLRCPSLYCGASLDSFSQAVATSAVSTGPHDQPWTAPVSVSLLWSFSGQFFTSCCHLGCVHWTSRPTMDCSGVRLFTVELLWTVFHKLLPPRLCPLDLTTNHGLLRCPSLYCGASLDSFSQAVATSAVSTGPHDQPWTAPVSVSLLWSFSGQFFTSCCHLGCVHWTSRPTMDCSGVRLFTVELLWTVFHKLLPPRLCPLDLTTNHGLLRCPSLYCGASLDSFSQAVATSAVSTGPHDQPWTAPVSVSLLWSFSGQFSQAVATSAVSTGPHDQPWTAPVSVSLLWSFSGQFFTSCCHLGCVHWTSRPTMDCSGVRLFTVELLWTVFHKLLPPRLCPLDLTTNHGLLRCPSLYCGASLDSFSQAVATSAVSTGPHDQPWTAPVSVSLLWSFSGQFFTSCCHLGCVHWTSRPTMDCSGVRLFTVELLWTVFHKLLPPRLCPLDLTTNHGLLRCPSLYCGASLDSFSQAVATSAVSTGPHDQPWTAPVSVSLLWSFSGQFFTSCCHLGCVHWTSRPTMDCSGVRLFTVELLWTVFHKLLPPRLCPLDLTTNHGLLRCPSLYCGASLDSFSQAVATSAVSTGPHDQPWTAPVSVSLLWSFSGQFFTSCCHLGCVHWTSRPTMDCSGVRLFTVELLWTVFHKLLPPRLCPLDLTTNHGLLRCPSLYCGASLDSFSQAVATSLPTPPPTSSHPPTPSVRWPKIGAHLQKTI